MKSLHVAFLVCPVCSCICQIMGHYSLWLVACSSDCLDQPLPSFPPLPFSLFHLSSLFAHSLPADCYNVSTLGQTYTGDMNITQNGKSCLPWRTAPAARGLVATYLELNGSFCRNPGQLGRMPWCFTSTSGDWEYCDVTLCSGNCGPHPALSLSLSLFLPPCSGHFSGGACYFGFWLSMGLWPNKLVPHQLVLQL